MGSTTSLGLKTLWDAGQLHLHSTFYSKTFSELTPVYTSKTSFGTNCIFIKKLSKYVIMTYLYISRLRKYSTVVMKEQSVVRQNSKSDILQILIINYT